MEKTTPFDQLDSVLARKKAAEDAQDKFWSDCIFDMVKNETLSKLGALELLTKYELLPVSDWIDFPPFMEPLIDGDRYHRTEVIYFYWAIDDKSEFLPTDGSEPYEYARLSEITQEEAINLTYDYVLEHKVIGCHFDW